MKSKVITALVFIISIYATAVVTTVLVQTPVQQLTTETSEAKLLKLVNEQRAKNSLPPLEIDNRLVATANLKNVDMIENRYYDHAKDGVEYYKDIFKIMPECKTIGENLAQSNESLETIVEEWMKSPTHKENILGDYQYTGISIKESDKPPTYGRALATQHFCSTTK